jgi:hypothetical protein
MGEGALKYLMGGEGSNYLARPRAAPLGVGVGVCVGNIGMVRAAVLPASGTVRGEYTLEGLGRAWAGVPPLGLALCLGVACLPLVGLCGACVPYRLALPRAGRATRILERAGLCHTRTFRQHYTGEFARILKATL